MQVRSFFLPLLFVVTYMTLVGAGASLNLLIADTRGQHPISISGGGAQDASPERDLDPQIEFV